MVCRTCLQGSELYKNIFDTEGIEFNLATIIKDYLGLEVIDNDTISTHICISCWNHLKSFHKFYCNIQDAQSKLFNAIYIKQGVDYFDDDNCSRDNINKSFEENDPIKDFNEIEIEKVDIDEVINSMNKLNNTTEAIKEQIQIERKREEQDSEVLSLSDNSLDVNNEISNSKIIQSINKENCELGLKESQEKQQYNSDNNIAENKKNKLKENVKKCIQLQFDMNTTYIRCELCNKTYADKNTLNFHNLRMHTPEDKKIHKCDICSKSFPKIYLLKSHKVTHVAKEEWNYRCEICGNAFASKSRLQTHTWYQHKEKEKVPINPDAYKCDICGKSLTTKFALRNHIRYTHKLKSTYQCNQCSKSFSCPKYLMDHMSIHTGEYLYACNYCPQMFKYNSSLCSHRRKMHLKEWEEEKKNKVSSEKNMIKLTDKKVQVKNQTKRIVQRKMIHRKVKNHNVNYSE